MIILREISLYNCPCVDATCKELYTISVPHTPTPVDATRGHAQSEPRAGGGPAVGPLVGDERAEVRRLMMIMGAHCWL
eukprot:COSAG01_NODE_44631_length_417_cov_0.751572_1_plen_78_part_00